MSRTGRLDAESWVSINRWRYGLCCQSASGVHYIRNVLLNFKRSARNPILLDSKVYTLNIRINY